MMRNGPTNFPVRLAWALWLIYAVTLTIVVGVMDKPGKQRTVAHTYQMGAEKWWARQDVYTEGIHGFIYFPQSAVLFTPFAVLPDKACEIAWRAFSLAVLAGAVWRLARMVSRTGGPEHFLLLSLLTIVASFGSARAGQMNLVLVALMIHAAAELMQKRWWRATFWLSLGVACKPLVLVMVLLAAAVYPPLIWRLLLGIAAVVVFPFLTAAPAYVLRQYQLCYVKLSTASSPNETQPFSDLAGLLRTFGVDLTQHTLILIRLLAAPLILALCWLGTRRWGRMQAAVLLLALTSCYLMIFNPRTEGPSFVILVPAVAVFAAWALDVDRWRKTGWFLLTLGIMVGISNNIIDVLNWMLVTLHLATPLEGKISDILINLGFTRFELHSINYWARPLLAMVFLVYITALILLNRQPGQTKPSAAVNKTSL